jgi:hypothetical protein
MGARRIDDRDGIEALRLAPQFVVLISEPRSADGRFARVAIHDAADGLSEVPFYILDADSEECQDWLASLNLPVVIVAREPGTGSLLWVSNGRVVEFSGRDQRLSAGQIVAKTRDHFYLDSDILREAGPG